MGLSPEVCVIADLEALWARLVAETCRKCLGLFSYTLGSFDYFCQTNSDGSVITHQANMDNMNRELDQMRIWLGLGAVYIYYAIDVDDHYHVEDAQVAHAMNCVCINQSDWRDDSGETLQDQ